MRSALLAAIAGSALCVATVVPAHAFSMSASAGVFTSTPGAVTFATFDAPTNNAIATVSGGFICPAAPAGSVCFGSTNPDGTSYIFTADYVPAITIDFTVLEDYFGFFWGSMDSFNTVSIFKDSTFLASFAGDGSQSNLFENITASNSGEFFNRITLTSTQCCFEGDNLAARAAVAAVAQPSGAALVVGGLTLLGLWTRGRLRLSKRAE